MACAACVSQKTAKKPAQVYIQPQPVYYSTVFTVERQCDIRAAIKAGNILVDADLNLESIPVPEGCVEGEKIEVMLIKHETLFDWCEPWCYMRGDLSPMQKVVTLHPAETTHRKVLTRMDEQGYRPADWTLLMPMMKQDPAMLKRWHIVDFSSFPQSPSGSKPLGVSVWESDGRMKLTAPYPIDFDRRWLPSSWDVRYPVVRK